MCSRERVLTGDDTSIPTPTPSSIPHPHLIHTLSTPPSTPYPHPHPPNPPIHTLRFRIAAVYTNNDNLLGLNSRRFLLEQDSNTQRPVEPPAITSLEPDSPTTVRMRWSYNPTPGIPVEGFFIHYREGTVAGGYTKVMIIIIIIINGFLIRHCKDV